MPDFCRISLKTCSCRCDEFISDDPNRPAANEDSLYFHDHSAIDEVEVQAETDRYIVMPGQALGYKIGQLKILELREKSKKALGAKFDIREFHDEILGAGALPMNVLEQRIERWIAAKKKA